MAEYFYVAVNSFNRTFQNIYPGYLSVDYALCPLEYVEAQRMIYPTVYVGVSGNTSCCGAQAVVWPSSGRLNTYIDFNVQHLHSIFKAIRKSQLILYFCKSRYDRGGTCQEITDKVFSLYNNTYKNTKVSYFVVEDEGFFTVHLTFQITDLEKTPTIEDVFREKT